MRSIDLNVDIGEGFPFDEALLEFATSANVCCGVHAGSWELTGKTVELCRQKGVRVGAHPGYPDRDQMGRRSIALAVNPDVWIESISDQIREFCGVFAPAYVKPHGALYNDTASMGDQENLTSGKYAAAQALLSALKDSGLPMMGLPNTHHVRLSPNFIREGFADRRYRANGLLVPRSEPDALLDDPEEIKQQVVLLTNEVDSICLHGDTPGAVSFAELVVKSLTDAGIVVRHP